MTINQAIIATLTYHDIFSYPLAEQELYRLLIGRQTTVEQISLGLRKLLRTQRIGESFSYYYLKNRQHLVSLRKLRTKYSKSKLNRAKFYANLLKIIPTVKLVAISGALAMENSHQNDDIDLVIISARKTLWTTRFLANLILYPFKRRPQSKNISDKACLNIFLDGSSLKINDQNLYIAHEICQMKPLWDRDGAYQKFVNANRWVKKYLTNWRPNSYAQRLTTNDERQNKKTALVIRRLALVARPLEALAKWGQLWYMRSKITTERIEEGQLFFHPKDIQEPILSEYHRRLKKLNIKV